MTTIAFAAAALVLDGLLLAALYRAVRAERRAVDSVAAANAAIAASVDQIIVAEAEDIVARALEEARDE